MNTAIDLGLLTALLYGISDFVARFSSRAVGVWRTLFWGELCSVSLLTLWIVLGHAAPPGLSRMPATVWVVTVAANLTILSATAIFYRALSIGRFSVVMPIVATYGAITALLAACLGQALGMAALGGIAVAVSGGAVASIPPRDRQGEHASPTHRGSGASAALAATAALLYGVGFYVEAHYAVPRLGHLIPIWLYYGCGVILLGGLATVLRKDLSPPLLPQLPVVLGTGMAASGAFVTLALAVTGGNVAVPTVLASLASVVTVILARVLIKEHVALHQWAGIGAVIAGLALLQGGAWL